MSFFQNYGFIYNIIFLVVRAAANYRPSAPFLYEVAISAISMVWQCIILPCRWTRLLSWTKTLCRDSWGLVLWSCFVHTIGLYASPDILWVEYTVIDIKLLYTICGCCNLQHDLWNTFVMLRGVACRTPVRTCFHVDLQKKNKLLIFYRISDISGLKCAWLTPLRGLQCAPDPQLLAALLAAASRFPFHHQCIEK